MESVLLAARGIPVIGTVYGVALNGRAERAALEPSFVKPPHQKPPMAPVLFIKPANTLAADGATVAVPTGADRLTARAALAVVFARRVTRVSPARALDHVLGYTLALDLAEPFDDLFRPPVRQICRDGFLPIGPAIMDRDRVPGIEGRTLVCSRDGRAVAALDLADLVRPIPALIAEISQFMSFEPGDALMVAATPKVVCPTGSQIGAALDGLQSLGCRLVAEAAS